MIMNSKPYPISFEREMSQALVCRYGEEMRQYIFKPDIDVSGLSCLLQIAKTDGTFTENGVEVHTDPDTGECTLVITIPKQATVVKGLNRYSICVYGPIEGEDHLLYSAEGPLWVDDNLITEEMIQSVAEVNGLVFPRDFLTVENLVDIVNYVRAQLINDNVTAEDTTWSSQKISDEIEGHTPDIDVSKEATGNPIEFSDGADAPLLRCVTQITGYQEGSGTPSPDNIRPIVAYSSGTVEVEDGDGNTTTHTATFPNAIYRGGADYVGRSASATRKKIVFTGENTEQWNMSSGDNYYQFFTPERNDVKSNNLLCNIFESITISDRGTKNGIINNNDGYIRFALLPSLGVNDVTGWRQFLSDHNVEVVADLVTPTTEQISITNLPVKSLSGYNHIESSTGELTLEYLTQTYDPIADLIDRSALHVYSTEEKIVGKWINNEDLYERIIVFSNVTINGGGSDYKYKGDLMIRSIIPEANIILPDIQHSYYVLNSDQFSFIGLRVNCTTGELVVVTLFAVTNADLHICLQYTKTS